MLNIDEIIHNYILIEIFHFFERKKILNILLKEWLTINKTIKNEKMKFFFMFLQYKKIVIAVNWKYLFNPTFKTNFLTLWYSKFLIFDGYKDFFMFWYNKSIQNKDNSKVAQWSYDLSERIYKNYFSKLLQDESLHSLLDLWCWNSQFLIFLATIFPQKIFYWIEINKETYLEWMNEISKLWLKNIKIYNWDILNIENAYFQNIDIITSFFVLHELPNLEIILNKICATMNPKYFVIKEFTPPKNILEVSFENNDQFFLTYLFIHFLTNQKTLQINDWVDIFNSQWYILNNIFHTEKYNSQESFYPLFEFKNKNQ